MSHDFPPPGPPPGGDSPSDSPAPDPAPTPAPDPYAARFSSPSTPPKESWPDKGMSTWALVLSLFPCLVSQVVSFVLAVVTLARGSSDGIDRGPRRAIAAIVISAAWIVGLTTLGVFRVIQDGGLGDADRPRTPGSTGSVGVTQIAVGDCLRDDPDEGVTYSLEVVSCTDPHYGEVYSEYNLSVAPYPGSDKAGDLAEDGCVERLPDYTSRPKWRDLDMYFIYPSSERNYDADPVVSCILLASEQVSTPFG